MSWPTKALLCSYNCRKLKHPPQNPQGSKQSSFQRGLCFQTWRVLLIVEQNLLYNFCGCPELTKQLGGKNYWLLFLQIFFHLPLRNIIFRAYTTQSKRGDFFFFFEWNVSHLKWILKWFKCEALESEDTYSMEAWQ